MRYLATLLFLLFVGQFAHGRSNPVWTLERSSALARRGWEIDERTRFSPGEHDIVFFEASDTRRVRAAAPFDVDLAVTPALQIIAHSANGPWRITAQSEDGPELLVGDTQAEGVFRTNLARALRESGRTTVILRIYMDSWEGKNKLRFIPSFEKESSESAAALMSGEMEELDRMMISRGDRIKALAQRRTGGVFEHPRLRFNNDNRESWRALAAKYPEYAQPISDIMENIEEHRAEEPFILTDEAYREKRPAWGAHLLAIRPPEPPELLPGEGGRLFNTPGLQTPHTYKTWRQLYWHNFSHWYLGAAISDEPDFAEQAKRWATTLAGWQFWLHPDYQYFDFNTSYPLQSFSTAYDITQEKMSKEERGAVRRAIADMAHGLYINTLSGHGAIRNDLRGNHTAVTMCGLGAAGLALLGEDERAPRWIALAEHMMLDSFNEHTTGAWVESPSYGMYGVNEWVRLAEMLRNVTGIDYMNNPFLRRYAEFQLHISDWEGRDLGYHGGGAGARWNQWTMHAVAREFRDERFQWLGSYSSGAGYGDRFWWVDPNLAAVRPDKVNTGRYFDDIGVSVWRTGWHDRATILLHKCGMKGQHIERDLNHVTLYAFGERILPDGLGGRTTDHNVPIINGNEQHHHPGVVWSRNRFNKAGATLAYHSDSISGYALGDTMRGYSNTRRHVLFLRPDAAVLLDEIPLDRGKHEIIFQLHPAGDVSIHEDILKARSGDVTLTAFTAHEGGAILPMSLKKREEERRGVSHTAEARFAALGRNNDVLRTATFLLMTPEGEAPVPELTRDGNRLRVEWGNEEIILGTGAGKIAPGITTTGELWLARFRDGKAKQILVSGKDEMAVNDTPWGQLVHGIWRWRTGFLEIDHETELRTPGGVLRGNPSLSWEPARTKRHREPVTEN